MTHKRRESKSTTLRGRTFHEKAPTLTTVKTCSKAGKRERERERKKGIEELTGGRKEMELGVKRR